MAVSDDLRGQDTDPSSQDATLSEVREQTLSGKSRRNTRAKKSPKPKRQSQRGVPMPQEFFAKIGWTRSFISGPADPIHNPHMVWCHMCKKNFSIKSKGPLEILRHHRTEKHLRRDQRWRYEHLRSVDPVSVGRFSSESEAVMGKSSVKLSWHGNCRSSFTKN